MTDIHHFARKSKTPAIRECNVCGVQFAPQHHLRKMCDRCKGLSPTQRRRLRQGPPPEERVAASDPATFAALLPNPMRSELQPIAMFDAVYECAHGRLPHEACGSCSPAREAMRLPDGSPVRHPGPATIEAACRELMGGR